MPAQQFDIRDQTPGRVSREVGLRRGRVRVAPPAAPLVEEHDAVGRRLKEPAVPVRASRPGAAVQDDRRLAIWTAAGLSIHKVATADVQHPTVVGIDLWIESFHEGCLPLASAHPDPTIVNSPDLALSRRGAMTLVNLILEADSAPLNPDGRQPATSASLSPSGVTY